MSHDTFKHEGTFHRGHCLHSHDSMSTTRQNSDIHVQNVHCFKPTSKYINTSHKYQ